MFNKLFSGQGSVIKMALLAAVPFIAIWAFFKSTPVRPSSVPVPAAVAVDTATWYNPFSWSVDAAANQAANDTLLKTMSYVQQARESDAASITNVLLTFALVAAVAAVLAKVLECKVEHPQLKQQADAAANAAVSKMAAKSTQRSSHGTRREEIDQPLVSA